MKIINSEKCIKSNQLEKIAELFNPEYKPEKIFIYENKSDVLKNLLLHGVYKSFSSKVLSGEKESLSTHLGKSICIYIFKYKEESSMTKQFKCIYNTLFQLQENEFAVKALQERALAFKSMDKGDIIETNLKYGNIRDEYTKAMRSATFKNRIKRFLESNTDEIAEIMNWESNWIDKFELPITGVE